MIYLGDTCWRQLIGRFAIPRSPPEHWETMRAHPIALQVVHILGSFGQFEEGAYLVDYTSAWLYQQTGLMWLSVLGVQDCRGPGFLIIGRYDL